MSIKYTQDRKYELGYFTHTFYLTEMALINLSSIKFVKIKDNNLALSKA